ncbi:TetR family transcriptional regulator [Dietzia sp. NCCP-2495]|uniref:TetR/AcrR family transcriptional regulator n=1 Tax=Dietzia sp. NCCP-2495 TaxID=2934675 RepID=UPI00222EE9EB|nr:TetR/AcrR family transcriptional regulator [Dietzia sp. NCCP-2495]GLB63572.1 TetR family transcriptional regulator [Dietzia sp. NCCP-2495]
MSTGISESASDVQSGRRRRIPRGEIQRQAILDAFESLLGEMSAVEITVKDITDAAGIKRPNFYFYFESKDEILAELVGEAWKAWDEAIGSYHRHAGETHADYFDRLFRVSHTVWVPRGRALVAGFQATAYDEKLRARWAELDEELYSQLADQMTRDAEAGLIAPPSDDHYRLVVTVTDMITYAFYRDRRLECTPEESARMLDSLKAVWLRAWGATDPAH